MSQNISSQAMLANVVIRGWSARRRDREVTEETNARYDADADAGNYNKALIAPGALKGVRQAAGAIRNFHLSQTVPWGDTARALSVLRVRAYKGRMSDLIEAYNEQVASFLVAYDTIHRPAAKELLGKMFDATEYPSGRDLRTRFGVGFEIMPLPLPSDFRADLPGDMAQQIRDEVEATFRSAQEQAQADLIKRVTEVAGRVFERVSAYKGEKGDRLYDTVISNVRDLADLLPGLNVTGDPVLAGLEEQLRKLGENDVDVLKGSENARSAAIKRAGDILRRIESMGMVVAA